MTHDEAPSPKEAPRKRSRLSPHDRLFRSTFRRRREASALIRPLLPARLAQRIDWKTLELQPGSFIDDELREHHTDLLFRVLMDGQPLLIYFLVEHQSQSERFMALRLLGYIKQVLDDYRQQHPAAETVPPLVPVVVSQAAQAWTAPLSMLELYNVDGPDREALAPYLPSFRYVLDDLIVQSEEALAQRALSASATFAVLFLRHARTGEPFAALLTRQSDLLRAVVQEPNGYYRVGMLVSYAAEVSTEDAEVLDGVLLFILGPRATEVVMTIAERWRQEGRQDGLREGRQDGLREGRQDGLREGRQLLAKTLTLLLISRFGGVPDNVRKLLEAASTEALDRWSERVMAAATLEDVFAEG